MPELSRLAEQAGFTISHVNVSERGKAKVYRYFLKDSDNELAAEGRSFDENELREYFEDRGKINLGNY
jgi:hypothetical protein